MISDLSVKNATYNTSDIPLNFSVNENVSQTSYCLDNQANVTVNGNTTLAGLARGTHSLVVYANDTAGNIGASNTTYFTVEQPKQQNASLFPITVIQLAIVVFLVVAVAALAIYRIRHSSVASNGVKKL
jgi:hypothetical protein